MRNRSSWTPRARLLWLFAAVVAGIIAWLEWASRPEPEHENVAETTVEFEVVE